MAAVQDLPIFSESDVVFSSLSWMDLLKELQNKFDPTGVPPAEIRARAQALTLGAVTDEDKVRELYEFVAHKLVTIDLPLGSTGFRLRAPAEILSSSYAIPEEKCSLLSALAWSIGLNAKPALTGINETAKRGPAAPSLLTNILIVARLGAATRWLDPSVEVAPFGVIAANLRGRPALVLHPPTDIDVFETVPNALPFAASQTVTIDGALSGDGELKAKVSYRLRGDNELLLREAFHQTPQAKWKEVAQLLALSDGFRGQVTDVKASDPYATREPFTVEYEVTQSKFVDWSKKPVRIPAILPLVGLPDPPAKAAPGAAASPIELGTPLDVETTATIRLPSGTTIETPTGTSVERDYATFASKYSIREGVITASRHIRFLLRELPATRAADYNAFVHAVQNDQAQLFTLDRSSTNSTKPSPLNPAPTRP